MARPSLPAFALLAAAAGSVTAVVLAGGDPPAQTGGAVAGVPFAGKAVLVTARDDVAVHFEDAAVRTIGTRQFVTGRERQSSTYVKSLFGGGAVWVPLDAVTLIVETGETPGAE